MIWHFAGVIAAAAAAHKAAEEAKRAAEKMKRAYGELSPSNSVCAYCQSEHSKEYCPNCGAPSARKADLGGALHRIDPWWGTKTSVPDHVTNPYLPAPITGIYDLNLGKSSEDDSRKRRDEEDQRKKRRDEDDERVRNSTPVWSPAPDYSSSASDTSSRDTGSSYSGGGGSFDGGGSSGDW